MQRILFFDLDGTLWTREEVIPESTYRAVQKARQRGHEVWINTGRTRAFVICPQLFEMGIDGMVTGNGTMIEHRRPEQEKLSPRWRENELLRYDEIPGDLAKWTVQLLKKHRFYTILEGRDDLYVDTEEFGDDPFITRLAKKSAGHLLPITGKMDWHFLKMSSDLRDAVEKNEGLEKMRQHYTVFEHGDTVVEFVPLGHTKGTGVQNVLTCRHMDREASVAFGDGRNDLEMFDAVALPIAMGNATEIAKQHSKMQTGRFDEHGIHDALVKIGVIDE